MPSDTSGPPVCLGYADRGDNGPSESGHVGCRPHCSGWTRCARSSLSMDLPTQGASLRARAQRRNRRRET
jgi:hypothetical protein